MLSITTDFVIDSGDPAPYLKLIAEAGFSHVHWCHHWCDDFLYSQPEIQHIARSFKEYGIGLLDTHASHGKEKGWGSLLEYERLAGVELVLNRLYMTAQLGGDAIVLHIPKPPDVKEQMGQWYDALHRTVDAVAPHIRSTGVRIALENMGGDYFEYIDVMIKDYSPEILGICYDCGHGNMRAPGLDMIDARKNRLIAVHLHDNDGQSDLHKIMFTGTVDWPRLAKIIAASSYKKCVSSESSIRNTGITDPKEFLKQAFEAGEKFTRMIAQS